MIGKKTLQRVLDIVYPCICLYCDVTFKRLHALHDPLLCPQCCKLLDWYNPPMDALLMQNIDYVLFDWESPLFPIVRNKQIAQTRIVHKLLVSFLVLFMEKNCMAPPDVIISLGLNDEYERSSNFHMFSNYLAKFLGCQHFNSTAIQSEILLGYFSLYRKDVTIWIIMLTVVDPYLINEVKQPLTSLGFRNLVSIGLFEKQGSFNYV